MMKIRDLNLIAQSIIRTGDSDRKGVQERYKNECKFEMIGVENLSRMSIYCG